MRPGYKADAYVAKYIYGWRRVMFRSLKPGGVCSKYEDMWSPVWVDDNNNDIDLPAFSSDSGLALSALEHLGESFTVKRLSGSYVVRVGYNGESFSGDTMPEAAVKAALAYLYQDAKSKGEHIAFT